jgi:hypothetical protein
MTVDPELVNLGVRLAETTVKGTWSKVSDKIRQIKTDKDKDSQIRRYDELVKSLVDEKSEIEDIAKAYKEQLEKITISDSDIESLHHTVESIVNIIIGAGFTGSETDTEKQESKDSINALLALLNSDTLKTLQLLGYNYKEAIGIPLTEVTADFISNKLASKKPMKNNKSKH